MARCCSRPPCSPISGRPWTPPATPSIRWSRRWVRSRTPRWPQPHRPRRAGPGRSGRPAGHAHPAVAAAAAGRSRSRPRRPCPICSSRCSRAGSRPSHGAGTSAGVDLRPYATDDADFWVFSDLTPGLDSHAAPMRPDFVLGLSSASSTLAQLTVRRPVGSALDLGTGCSVQTLHLATHAESITATDVNPPGAGARRADPHPQRGRGRAARRLPLRTRTGSPLRPDHHQPAVRDVAAPHRRGAAGLPGDRLRRRRADGAPGPARRRPPESGRHLPDPRQLGAPGRAAPGTSGWRAGSTGSGLDAHVVQREVLEVPAYVELWLADAGLTGVAGLPTPVRRVAGLLRRARHRGGRDGLAAAHPGRTRRPVAPVRGLAVRRRAADRPGLRRRSRVDQRLAAARGRAAGPRLGADRRRAWRRPPASPAPPTRSTSCSASSAASAERSRPTPVLAGVLGACDGDLPLGADRRRPGRPARGRSRRAPRRHRCPGSAPWSPTAGSPELDALDRTGGVRRGEAGWTGPVWSRPWPHRPPSA